MEDMESMERTRESRWSLWSRRVQLLMLLPPLALCAAGALTMTMEETGTAKDMKLSALMAVLAWIHYRLTDGWQLSDGDVWRERQSEVQR